MDILTIRRLDSPLTASGIPLICLVTQTIGSVVMFFLTSDSKNLLVELSKTNWSALALGIAIVGLEFGYICIYRAGWKIGVASLVANISLACVLLLIGLFVYKEVITLKQLLGMGICAVGLMLIVK